MGSAAHGVAMGTFYATLPFGDALYTAAQAYLPSARAKASRKVLIRTILRLGALTGGGTCAVVALPIILPALTKAFTLDLAVGAAIRTLLPFAGA